MKIDIKELRRFADELDTNGHEQWSVISVGCALFMKRSADHIEQQEAEIARLRKDAERYQWLRGANSQWGNDWQYLVGVFLDAEVDSAILADTSTQSTDQQNVSINGGNIDISDREVG